jgi:dTDP-4-dehydrorhamnose 3,5-epimerase-like enzyme
MFKDNRGYLIFPVKNNKYIDNITTNKSKDCTYSVNKKNVFRGLHINSFGKLITCITGSFIDIMINIEDTLNNLPKVNYYYIKPGDQIYCPPGYAHGFFSLEDNSVLSYHCEGFFSDEVVSLLNYKDPILDIKLPEGLTYNDIIINEKDRNAPYLKYDFFLLGSSGFIGSNVLNELRKRNLKILCLKQRLHEKNKINELLQFYKPKYFINCAGLTGTPDISWCDKNKFETIKTNVINQIELLEICENLNIHYTLLGSGAIFKNIEQANDSTEGNNYDSFYSECRILLEKLVKNYSNYLLLRINYPISFKEEYYNNKKNLLNKLMNYDYIENISLSITNLDIQIPQLINLIKKNKTGIVNFVMSEQQSLKRILEDYTGKSLENLNKKLKKSERSTTKLIVKL